MSGDRPKKPAGWYSKDAKAQRAAAHAERRAAAADRKRPKLTPLQSQAARMLANAKLRLRERHADTGVPSFEARMARLAQAEKRNRQRVDHLVLGKPRPEPVLVRPDGMSKGEWKHQRKILLARGMTLEPGIEEAVRRRELFDYGRGTPETNANLETFHSDSLIQLERNGTISKEQVEYAAEIANVYRSIESDVAVKVASFEARVDNSGRAGAVLIAERISRVRTHLAYTIWREQLPSPKQAILDMIVSDAVGYTVVARRYGWHARKAKRRLIEAIDRWPSCRDRAFEVVDREVYGAISDGEGVALPDDWRTPLDTGQRIANTEPVILGVDTSSAADLCVVAIETADEIRRQSLDPRFLDEKGYMLPWADIAEIIRGTMDEQGEAA